MVVVGLNSPNNTSSYLPTVPILEGQSLFLEPNFLLSHSFSWLQNVTNFGFWTLNCVILAVFIQYFQFVPFFDTFLRILSLFLVMTGWQLCKL